MEWLLSAAKRSDMGMKETVKDYEDQSVKERKERGKEKVPLGKFIQQTEDVD